MTIPVMAEEDYKKKAQSVEEVYQRYLLEIRRLKEEQDRVIDEFIKVLEDRKMEQIRKNIDLE